MMQYIYYFQSLLALLIVLRLFFFYRSNKSYYNLFYALLAWWLSVTMLTIALSVFSNHIQFLPFAYLSLTVLLFICVYCHKGSTARIVATFSPSVDIKIK